jgi:hypothetical protein
MATKRIYKIIFLNHGKVYELFARNAVSSGLYGFIEVEGLIFDSTKGLVVDTTEERMQDEFSGCKVLHLPMHSVVRIEEVEKRGTCLIRDRESGEKIMPFPLSPSGKS